MTNANIYIPLDNKSRTSNDTFQKIKRITQLRFTLIQGRDRTPS